MISDQYSVPLEDEHKYMEKIYRLSKIWSVFKPTDSIKINNETPALMNNYISFGCFNNIKKINLKVIELWSKILSRIENSRLYLSSYIFCDKDFTSYFKNFFKNFGAKEKQLYFEDSIPQRTDFLNKYNSIDIALDTFPYNGGTTSFELSKMTVPLLTKKGDSFVSRCGFSINKNLSMEDWIANNNNDYISKAIKFSKDIILFSKYGINLLRF
jgi:predicted O-linked N-acetylglucosamine transferase (SPINDLY family)